MKAAYAEYVGLLEPPSGADFETVEDVAAKIKNGGALIAWIGSEAVGSARFEFRGEALYAGRLSVLPAYRGRGIGTALMSAIEAIGKENRLAAIEILVRSGLEENLKLYRKLGFSYEEILEHPRAGKVTRMVKHLFPTSDTGL